MRLRRREQGITLTELLLTVSIIAVLVLVLAYFLRTNVMRARDAERKADLERIKIAFEDYFNDNGCYPDPSVLQDCGASSFSPYLTAIPCDPVDGEPYLYQPLADQCKGYRVYSSLEDPTDPIIAELGCQGPQGCGPGPDYTYGISVGTSVNGGSAVTASSPTPGPSGSPTPAPSTIYVYACDSSGTCNQFEENHPFLLTCPITFPTTNCNNRCAEPAVRCDG